MSVAQWRAIPGFEGAYEISEYGEIRSYRQKGRLSEGKSPLGSVPHTMQPMFRRHGKSKNNPKKYYAVHLTDNSDRSKEYNIMQLMVLAWFDGGVPGKVPYHKNGDLSDNWRGNIAFATPQELGKKTGAQANRRPVMKIDRAGNVVEVYPSARAAGRENYISYQTVIDRCNNKIKNPFALDGYTYAYESQN